MPNKPKIGDIKRGFELGKKQGRALFIWTTCVDCGEGRWVAKCSKPLRCFQCAKRKVAQWYRGNKHHSWRGGRVIRDGYAYIYLQPDDFFYPMANKKGYVAEHRLVIAKALGRCLLPWEIPHHKTGFAKDGNRYPETLELMTDKRFHMVDLITKRLIAQLKKQVNEQGKRITLLEAENVLLRKKQEVISEL